MIERLDSAGYWHLPDNPDCQLPGTLTFTPEDGPRLELLGDYEDPGGTLRADLPDQRVILGRTSDGMLITLCHNSLVDRKQSLPGMTMTTYHPQTIVIGLHFNDPDDIRVRCLDVRYTYLDRWLGISGGVAQYNLDEQRVTIDYSKPRPIELAKHDCLTVFARFSCTFPSPGAIEQVTVSQQAWLTLESDQPRPYGELLETHWLVNTFLSFAVGKHAYPIAIEARLPALEMTGGGADDELTLKILYQQSQHPPEPKRLHSWEMLLPFGHAREDARDALSVWLAKSQLLGPVYTLYHSAVFSSDTFVESRFLLIVQAVEVFHRRMRNNSVLSVDDYQERQRKVLDLVASSLGKGLSDWVGRRFGKHGNEPSLQMRLLGLGSECGPLLKPIGVDTNALVDDVVRTRNYLTHYDGSLASQAVTDGVGLMRLVQVLALVLEDCLLRELGVSPETARAALSTSARYRLARQLVSR
jgi:hypothetical protein